MICDQFHLAIFLFCRCLGQVTNLMKVPIHQWRSTARGSEEHWSSSSSDTRTGPPCAGDGHLTSQSSPPFSPPMLDALMKEKPRNLMQCNNITQTCKYYPCRSLILISLLVYAKPPAWGLLPLPTKQHLPDLQTRHTSICLSHPIHLRTRS